MKYWKCPLCGKIKETKDDIIMVICGNCQESLKPYPEYNIKTIVEVKN